MRDKYPTFTVVLTHDTAMGVLLTKLRIAPIDKKNPIEVVIREQVKARKPDQNALYWAGPLKDIAEQAYVDGRTFSAAVWHEFMKQQYLPNENHVDTFDSIDVKNPETYKKWDYMPSGDRVLVGSSTDLSVIGFSKYLEKVHAYGANLGVQFSTTRQQ